MTTYKVWRFFRGVILWVLTGVFCAVFVEMIRFAVDGPWWFELIGVIGMFKLGQYIQYLPPRTKKENKPETF